MELLESTKDYIFAFCVYSLFNAWNIYIALRSHSMHRPSLFVGLLGGALILYFLFLALSFTKRTKSRLEKWIGAFTVAICIVEAGKLLIRFASQAIENPIQRYFAVGLYGIAFILATMRTIQVLRFGVRGGILGG
jgi:hypothetical protein